MAHALDRVHAEIAMEVDVALPRQ